MTDYYMTDGQIQRWVGWNGTREKIREQRWRKMWGRLSWKRNRNRASSWIVLEEGDRCWKDTEFQ